MTDTKELREKLPLLTPVRNTDGSIRYYKCPAILAEALPGLLDEVERLEEDNGALADRVALHYEEWHAEGEKRVKAEDRRDQWHTVARRLKDTLSAWSHHTGPHLLARAERAEAELAALTEKVGRLEKWRQRWALKARSLYAIGKLMPTEEQLHEEVRKATCRALRAEDELAALAEKERQKDEDLMRALQREDALRADLAALRERMEAVRRWVATNHKVAFPVTPVGWQHLRAILSDDQPATGSHGDELGLTEEQVNSMARGEEPATGPPAPTQEQIQQNNVWLAAVEARGFCRMLEVSEADVTLSPAYEALLEALKLAGLDVHAEPATEPKP